MAIRKVILTGSALVVTLVLAGCSGAKSSSAGSTSTPRVPAAAPSAAAISGRQLTGTQLTAALLTSSEMPVTGFSDVTGSDSDSGGSLTTVKAEFTPGTMSCADLQNAIGAGGFGEIAWSSRELVDGGSSNQINVSQTVYQFADAGAANAFFTAFRARTNSSSCRTFTISSLNIKLTVTVTAAKPGVGQQDFANTMIGTDNGHPTALASTVALDGSDVLMVGADNYGGATVPTDIDSGSLLAKLIGKVAAAG